MEIWSEGSEGAYGLRVSIARHCYDVHFSTNINSRSIGIDDWQHLQTNTFIGFALFPAHKLFLVKKWGRLGPAAESV
jgi:hypothetical protein